MKKALILFLTTIVFGACKENPTPGELYDYVDFIYAIAGSTNGQIPEPTETETAGATIGCEFNNAEEEDQTRYFLMKAGGFFRDYSREASFRLETDPANPELDVDDFLSVDLTRSYSIGANELTVPVPVVCHNRPDMYTTQDFKGKEIKFRAVVETNDYFEAVYWPNYITITIQVGQGYE